MASTRRTYDTDSIVLRRIFAYNPADNLPFSTNFLLTSVTKGACTFSNPVDILSTAGYGTPGEISSLVSTLNADILSVIRFFSPFVPSSQEIFLPSTCEGLGTFGYISTASLTSTTIGLGTLGYISSGITFDALQSTTEGLGTFGYLSSLSLFSTLDGLGTLGYVSSASLFSTVEGLGTYGYVSSTKSIYRSTYAVDPAFLIPNSCNIGFMFSNIQVDQAIRSIYTVPLGDLATKITNQTKLDIEFEPNIQYTYFNPASAYFSMDTFFSLGETPTPPDTFLMSPSTLGVQRYQYYILNNRPINIANMFKNTYRFIVEPRSDLSELFRPETTLRLYHQFPNIPSTNQFYFFPTSSSAVTVIVDNTPAN
jgi:hypothetical protein